MSLNLQTFRQKLSTKATPYFLLGSLVFLYLQTFILPFIPIYLGDNAPVYLLDGKRMLQGEVIYRDFFELTFPGTPLLYCALFKLFGVHAWIPNALLIALGVGLLGVSVALSQRVLSGAAVFLPGLFFLIFAYGNALDATHHWFSVLAALGAAAVLLEKRSLPRLAWAGALCGLATLFTQSRGLLALLALAVFLCWERRAKKLSYGWLVKTTAVLSLAFLAIVVPVVTCVAWEAGWRRFFYCTFIFVRKCYSFFSRNNLGVYAVDVPEFSSWLELPAWAIWVFIHVLVPLIFILFLVRYAREAASDRPHESWDQLLLINLMGLFSFLAIAPSPTWFKLCTASLPALIVFVWFLRSPGKLGRVFRGLLWVAILLGAVAQPAMRQTDWRGLLGTPVGRAAFVEPLRYEKFRWLRDRTQPGQYLFEAGDTALYFLLDLRNPAEVPFLTPTDYTRPEQVQRTVQALEKHRVPFVVWSVDLDLPEPDQVGGDHLGPLRAYLRAHYRVVKTFDDGSQVWQLF